MADPTQDDVNRNDIVQNSPLPPPSAPVMSKEEKFLYDHHLSNLGTPIQNEDGSQSTLRAFSAEIGGKTFMLPSIWEGKQLTEDEAVAKAKATGLDQFPSYGSTEEADARYAKLHDVMANDLPGQSGAAADARHAMELKAQERRQNTLTEQQRQQGIGNREPNLKLEGPNADEAMDTLAKWRGAAHLKPYQELPGVYRSMAEARASGYTWDEINKHIQDAKDAAKAAGYTNDQINHHLFGMSLENHAGAPVPGAPLNIPAELGDELRRFSDELFGPRNVGAAMGLPEPGVTSTFGSMISHFGWNMLDFVKTFPAGVVTGAGATAEMFDGKDRTDMEWIKLGWEASGFLAMFIGPAAKMVGKVRGAVAGAEIAGAPKPSIAADFPKFQDFLDSATSIANKHPEGLTDNTLGVALSSLGEHFSTTGEHPVEVASSVNSYEQFLQKRAAAANENVPRSAAEPPVPYRPTAADDAATFARLKALAAEDTAAIDALAATSKIDRLINPSEVTKLPDNPAFADLSKNFKELMSDESGAITIGARTDIRPEDLFRPDPLKFGKIVNEVRAFLEPAYLSPKASEAASSTMAWSALRMEQAAHALNQYGRYIGELSTTMRYNLMAAYERGLLPIIEDPAKRSQFETAYPAGTPMREMADNYLKPGSPLFGLFKEIGRHTDMAYADMVRLGIEPAYIDNYLGHIWKDFNAAKSWMAKRPLSGNKSFTKARVFGDILEGIDAGLTPVTDNPVNMVLVKLKSMRQYIQAHETFNQFQGSGAILDASQVSRAMLEDGWKPIPQYFGLKETHGFYAHPDAARILENMTNPGFNKFSTYRLLRDIANGVNSITLAGPGFHATFVTLDTVAADVGLAMQEMSRALLNPVSGKTTLKEPLAAASSLIRAPFSPVLNSFNGILMKRLAQGESVPGFVDRAKLQEITQAYIEGGGRFGLHEDFKTSRKGSFLPAILSSAYIKPGPMTLSQELGQMMRDASGSSVNVGGFKIPVGIAKVTGQIFARSLDTIADPLMGHYVPWLKAGLFYRQMESAMRAVPSMGPLEQRHVAWGINRVVDNRIGEMVYDNVFWNQYVKSAGQLIFRAVGFNFGDIDTAIRGSRDIMLLRTETIKGTKLVPDKNGVYAPEQVRQFTEMASALVGVALTTALIGGAIMYMSGTWNEDRKPLDYLYPPIDDKETRIKLPGYGNAIYEMTHHTKQALYNRLNPMWTMLAQGLENRQWDGKTAITKTGDGVLTNAKDYSDWAYHQLWPYSLSQYYHPTDAQKELDPAVRMLGVQPAPWDVRNPEKAKKWELRERKAAEKKLDKQRAKREADDQERKTQGGRE